VPATKAIVVGSGAGGSTVAMELAESGWDVVIFEKGSNYYTNLDGVGPFGTTFSNDELKALYRYFEQPDPIAYPRTFRHKASQPASYVGRTTMRSRRCSGRREMSGRSPPSP
jgi:choline dehydrogenase-like flavoprotein